jgi:hypothetical protein
VIGSCIILVGTAIGFCIMMFVTCIFLSNVCSCNSLMFYELLTVDSVCSCF